MSARDTIERNHVRDCVKASLERKPSLLIGVEEMAHRISHAESPVLLALRTLERPLQVTVAEIEGALNLLSRAVQKRYELVPFEVDLHLETSTRLWWAAAQSWVAGDEHKTVLVLRSWDEKFSLWCPRASELMAVLSSWWADDRPTLTALAAMRVWLKKQGGEDAWRVLPRDTLIAWLRSCTDEEILARLLSQFLRWCGGVSCRHRRWQIASEWTCDRTYRKAVACPQIVSAVEHALGESRADRPPAAVDATRRVVRAAATRAWSFQDASGVERALAAEEAHEILSRRRARETR